MSRITTCLSLVAVFAITCSAQAAFIDFDDGPVGSPIGGFYSGLGITFSNGAWRGPLSNQNGTPSSGNVLVDITDTGGNPPFTPQPDTPIVATFSSPQLMVSILAVDVGSNGVQIDAYDAVAGGNLIGSDSFIGSGNGVGAFLTLEVASAAIRRFELYQPRTVGGGEGVFFDNLSFSPVPEPSAFAISVSALCCIGLVRRKRA